MIQHSFLTLAIPFDRDRRAAVEAALDTLKNPNYEHEVLDKIDTLHFISGSVIPGGAGEKDHLLFELTVDGSVTDGLGLFDGPLGTLVRPAIEAAEPDIGQPLSQALKPIRTGQGLLDTPGLNFIGTPGMTVKRIHQERKFARLLRDIFDANPPIGDPLTIVQRMRNHVATDPAFSDLKHLLVPEPTPFLGPAASPEGLTGSLILRIAGAGVLTFLWPVLAAAVLAATIHSGLFSGRMTPDVLWSFLWTLLCVAVVVAAVTIGLFVWLLRACEESDVSDNSVPNMDVLREAVSHEDHGGIMQNHLTGVSRMKPGWFRRLTLRVGFWLIGQFAQRVYRPGYLGALGTIHSARWVMIPSTDKLVFLSNYGGSWESYLEDFITKASAGLTAVWSNTLGFPKTRLLILGGATDGDRFKRWARRQQVPTRFWYSHYFSVSTGRIRANAAIRDGIASASTVDEAQAWLSLFGSQIRNETVVEKADIQSIMGSGFGNYPYASCLLLKLPPAEADAKTWLSAVFGKITYGDVLSGACIHQIAFSAPGLRKLGMTEDELSQFSLAFQMGMADPSRQRILSDTGPDHPARWSWGGDPEDPIDGALLIYAREAHQLDEAIAEARTELERRDGHVRYVVNTTRIANTSDPGGKPREPFGFVDGLSQPIIRGLSRPAAKEDGQHIVEPGEFVLGYVDNRGFVVEAPTVRATRDPDNLLPAAAHVARTSYPQFAGSAANADRAIGRNGSYLVVRQLKQHTANFQGYIDQTEAKIASHPAVMHFNPDQRKHYIAAKMVGRWEDGSSLVRYPREPASGWHGKAPYIPDNEFLFGAEDPLGEACPFGAHIRRSNPRESLEPGSQEQIAITNRHRILRRGRFYRSEKAPGSSESGTGSGAEGLLFICANADIERQFEFIQQTWAMAWQFHGLENEVDPILSRGRSDVATGGAGEPEASRSKERKLSRLTIPTAYGPINLTNIPNFVDVLGGAYLFLPGQRMLRWLSTPKAKIERGMNSSL
jgi:deferrochelatase/peroxidase EfeB